MRLALICAAALAAASAATAAPPPAGTLVPGRSLGGIGLSESADAVRAALGRDYYIFRGRVWGFGLLRPRADPCR